MLDEAIPLTSSRSLAGRSVLGQGGEEVGVVVDVMIDLDSGYVLYVVLQMANWPEREDVLFPVPWGSVRLDGGRLRFDATLDQLAHAPSFPQDEWPDLAAPAWRKAIHNHYSASAYWHDDLQIGAAR